jgi:acylphosphatase
VAGIPPGGRLTVPIEPTASAAARVEAVAVGRVQGVGFRFHVERLAAALGLVGWVANEADGSVRCVAEGPRHVLEAFVRDLAEGPSAARVERVSVAWSQATGGLDRFEVRSGWHSGD